MTNRIFLRLLCPLLLVFAVADAAAVEDLLPPEQAFRFSARQAEPGLVEVRYRIADGYYMYRDKFRFSAQPSAVGLGEPRFQRGVIKQDEFFGRVETYRGEALVYLPLTSPEADGFVLNATSQGCADAGVCFPPQTQSMRIAAAGAGDSAMSSLAAAREPSGLLAKLKGGATNGEPDFLPVDQAFSVQARMPDAKTIVVRFVPEKGYYLYRDKISFSVDPGAGVSLEPAVLPRGSLKKDPNFGDTEVFHDPFQATLRLKGEPGSAGFVLNVGYQGCSEKGLCYPPEKKRFSLSFKAAGGLPPANAGADIPPVSGPVPGADDRRIAQIFGSGGFWVIVASFLGFGVLLSFTPCMLPMIPILSGIIAGQGKRMTRTRGFLLSATYVLGMAIAYAIAGVSAGLSGTLLSSALQNPWVLGAFALIFVALSLSMFGFYQFQLPATWQGRLAGTSNRLRGGTLTGVFVMGALSAVIVGPCVAAPLAGALLYIGQSGDMVLGGAALFAMALGMGLPLLAVGISAGALLPKAGIWMQSVKNLFGVMLLGAAVWIISPVIPAMAQMLLWAAMLIVSAIFLRAIDALPPDAGALRKLGKGIGIVALLLGFLLLVGALSGGKEVLQPLSGLRQAGETSPGHTPFVRVRSLAELDAAVAAAGRPVMLDFYADWCVACKEMERFTFSDVQVQNRLAGMLLLQVDVTANSAEDKALLRRFSLFGPPGIIFFDAAGRELTDIRVIGFQPAGKFAAVLDSVLRQ